jgi:RNA polymerase sigma factor (sigma-70 family)
VKNSNYYKNKEDLHFRMTSPEEERDLFRKAQSGDSEARNFLIKNHLLFVATFARRHNRGRLPDDEIISAANSALMNAVGRFDPERGNRFTRYLVPFLRGALASLWKEKNTVEPKNGDFPEFTQYTEEERDGEGPGKAARGKVQKQIAELVPSTDELVADAEDLSLNLSMLSKCKAKLTAAEKELLRLIYEEGISMADIARDRGVSRQAIHQSHGQIVEKLRAAFKRKARG